MTRGRLSNVAYVATDEAHVEEHQHTPGHEDEVTARTILCGVLQHEGAEKSAHEAIEAEQEKWSSIAQLAAEYETIAQAAQHQRFSAAFANSVALPTSTRERLWVGSLSGRWLRSSAAPKQTGTSLNSSCHARSARVGSMTPKTPPPCSPPGSRS